MSRIWEQELAPHGVRVLSVDPGDMDTDLHAVAVPDADRAALKRPLDAAREIVHALDPLVRRPVAPSALGSS